MLTSRRPTLQLHRTPFSRFPDASLSACMRVGQCRVARAARRKAVSGARRGASRAGQGSGRRRGRDSNPRPTFRQVRDFQSRSFGRSDTSPGAASVAAPSRARALLLSGGGEIRTLAGRNRPERFSRPPHSTALPPLREEQGSEGAVAISRFPGGSLTVCMPTGQCCTARPREGGQRLEAGRRARLRRAGAAPAREARNGEGGIRTLEGGIFPLNALAGRRLQPLGHFSGETQDSRLLRLP